MSTISSFQNPLVKRIRRLAQKKYRRQEGAGFLEGLRAVITAVEEAPHLLDTVVYAPDLLDSSVAYETLNIVRAYGHGRVQAVTAEVFANISERDNPRGLGAIVHTPVRPLADLPVADSGIYVVLERISDPGNLGTILRCADAVGATAVILLGIGTDVTHPTALRAGMGTAFTVPVAEVDTADELWAWATEHEIAIIATTANTDRTLWKADYPRRAALLLGNEGDGLPADLLARADQTVTIPMYGQASSLNVAMAAGVLLYELRRYYEHGSR